MAEMTTEEIVKTVHGWAVDRIETLTRDSSTTQRQVQDALALADEFKEWFEDDGESHIDVISIEQY